MNIKFISLIKHRRLGFTLIEILAAMTVLVFLVLMLTKVYTEGANAWKTGTRNSTRNMNARAVMDFMSRELSMAAFEFGNQPASNFLSMAYNANTVSNNFGLEGADEIYFIRLNKQISARAVSSTDTNAVGKLRSAELIRYYVANYITASGKPEVNSPLNPEYRFKLMRDQNHPSASTSSRLGVYANIGSTPGLFWMGQSRNNFTLPDRQAELIDNVRTFEVFAYTDAAGRSQSHWRSFGTNRLAFLDIYLETFDEADAARAATLAAALGPNHPTTVEFVERSVKRNYRRVVLMNKQGFHDKW